MSCFIILVVIFVLVIVIIFVKHFPKRTQHDIRLPSSLPAFNPCKRVLGFLHVPSQLLRNVKRALALSGEGSFQVFSARCSCSRRLVQTGSCPRTRVLGSNRRFFSDSPRKRLPLRDSTKALRSPRRTRDWVPQLPLFCCNRCCYCYLFLNFCVILRVLKIVFVIFRSVFFFARTS